MSTRRVPSTGKAPRLRRKLQQRVESADDKSARGYEALEDATLRLAKFAAQVRAGDVVIPLDDEEDTKA